MIRFKHTFKIQIFVLLCLFTALLTSCVNPSPVTEHVDNGEPPPIVSDTAEDAEEALPPLENDKQTTFGAVMIMGEPVNVRSGADMDADVIGRVHKGTVLALLRNGEENGFYMVSYSGNPAYVSSELSVVLSGDSADLPPSQGEKLIALTFDDGPSPALTPRLLDILSGEQVRVTFFVQGSSVKANPGIVRRAAEEGHEIGSHTYSHKDLTTLSAARLAAEIHDTVDVIRSAGAEPTVTRPPYGAYNDAVVDAIGTPVILWSIDPMDWKFRDADIVYQNVVNVAADGDIILLHDVHETSVDAAAMIIPALKARGFRFVTVSELISARGGTETGPVYAALRP